MHRIRAFGWAALLISLCAAVSAEIASVQFFSDLTTGQPQGIEAHTDKGNWLVVMIWASNCHVCNAEAKSYAEFHAQNVERGVRVLGISMDGDSGRQAALDFVKRHGLPFRNLIAEPGALGLYYEMSTGEGLRGTPTLMVL
jgi:peroxiredoxin